MQTRQFTVHTGTQHRWGDRSEVGLQYVFLMELGPPHPRALPQAPPEPAGVPWLVAALRPGSPRWPRNLRVDTVRRGPPGLCWPQHPSKGEVTVEREPLG